jgi:hypothetical protein
MERKIVTIHRGEKYRRERREKKRGEKEDIDSVERHGNIDRGKETEGKIQKGRDREERQKTKIWGGEGIYRGETRKIDSTEK